MLSGDQGVSELAEGHTFIRGRCKQFGNPYTDTTGSRDDGRCFSGSEYEILVHKDDFGSPVDGFEKQSANICRRVSMTPGDATVTNGPVDTPSNGETPLLQQNGASGDRRLSRDIGIQAFSLEIEEEKEKLVKNLDDEKCNDLKHRDAHYPNDHCYMQRDRQQSIVLRRDSCHFHKVISPQNEMYLAHCSGTTPLLEYRDSLDAYKSHEGTSYVEVPTDVYSKQKCCCNEHCHCSIDSTEHGPRYSTCSSDSSTLTKCAPENIENARRCSKWKSGLVYYMDPCIEDSNENAAEDEYNESEQCKPLLSQVRSPDQNDVPSSKYYENRANLNKKKSVDEAINRPSEGCVVPNVEGIELANDAVCPFGLAKNLEKQICIIPSRKKKSSVCPSFLKLVTLILIGSAILITSAAIKEAYY